MGLENVFIPSGNLTKVHIEAYSDDAYNSLVGAFDVLYNPNTYDVEYKNEFDTSRPENANDSLPQFKSAKGKDLVIELLWDATGASFTGIAEEFTRIRAEGHVEASIQRFLALTFELQADTHRPNFLKVNWGTLMFQGVLTSAKVTYSLFANDGKPLRAKMNCTFMSHRALEEQAAETQRNSPDLTHYLAVDGSLSLPSLSFKVYRDPKYYLEVAKHNRLNNFRSLKQGTRLAFPPIEKTK